MKEVYKYPLQLYCSKMIPKGAQILCLKEQNGEVCMWVLVDPKAEVGSTPF